ncbi:MAG: LysE family transporter [Pseudomonadota bacterium]
MISAFATLALVHLAAVVSPGPSFLVCSRIALSDGRIAGFAVAGGMALGTLLWALGALIGLAVLFEQAQWMYQALRIAGGAFLVFIAIQSWRHAGDALPTHQETETSGAISLFAAFRLGLFTQLSNPKVAIFFASIFLAVLPPGSGALGAGVALVIVTANEFFWYAAVATGLSSAEPRRLYLSYKAPIERALAIILGLIGIRIAVDG